MADEAAKDAQSAEKAYAAAAAAVSAPKAEKDIEPVEATKPALKDIEVTQEVAAPEKPAPAPKAAAKKAAPKKAPAAKATKTKVKSTAPVPGKKSTAKASKPAPRKTPSKKQVTQIKEPTMAKTPDFMKSMTDAMAEMQSKAKEAYEKGTEMTAEATEFAKGNVEALVESGKILSAAVQDMGKTYVDEAKSAFETMTADMKEIAAIKSPTELFQLQGKLLRRNFDSAVAFGSKSSENMIKLANDVMAPISGRMSTAAEKISKVA